MTTRNGNTGDTVFLEIHDQGIGIPDHHRNRLFTQGFTTKQGHHGLGLHYAANAMHEMGGDIFAESKGEGQGATFLLELPVAEVEEDSGSWRIVMRT